MQLVQFVLDLENLQTGQTAQGELADGVRLGIVKAELGHDGGFRLRLAAAAVADGVDDVVHDVHGAGEALQDVGPLLGLVQVVLGAPADDLVLELDIPLQHGLEAHHLGHAAVQRQQVDAHGVLQLGVAVELVQHHLGVGLFLQLDDDPHAVAVGLVVQIADSLDPLVFYQVRNALDEAGLVDHVGNFGDDDLEAAVLLFLNFGPAPQGNFAAAGGVGGANAAAAHDDTAGGEVRPFDVLHQAGQVDVRVLDEGHRAVDDFAEVVGRDVGGHAHGDTGGAVDQEVREPAGQNAGLFFVLVKVGAEVHRVLVDVGEQLHGHLAHPGLGVSVGSRGVAVHAAEVALTVHQGIAHGEVLGQTHHGVVNGGVAVGVVAAQHGAHGVGALAVGVLGVVAPLVHGVKDTPVHRFQAVPHVGQGAGDDDGHGVIKKGALDLVLHVPHDELGAGAGDHHKIFVQWCSPVSFFNRARHTSSVA